MIDRVTDYAQRVVAGEVVAGGLHVAACERHLRDLERQETEEFPYYWDVDASRRIIEYAETLTIAEGAEPRPLELLDCQAFDLGCRFGWYNARGFRRFRRSYKSMARQNGKSMENGIIGTYVAAFCGYHYGKLFTAATKRRQARIAWDEMAKFIRIDPDLQELFSVKEYKSEIKAHGTGCVILALSKDEGLEDGHRAIFCSVDELHQHRDHSVFKSLSNGQRALDEALISMITTRGEKLNSFGKEMDDYAVKVLKGAAIAEDFFVDVYALDEGDDIWDEENWVKANPYLCTSKSGMESLRSAARTARDMGGSDLRDFLIKSLNMWVQNTDDNYIDIDKWNDCADTRTLEDFRGKTCYVGLDLSSGGDLTTIALEFPEGDERLWWYSHSFMPRGRLEEHIETDLAPYDLWESKELITVTGGMGDFKNDFRFIIRRLRELKDEYELEFAAISIDPHNADGILADLEDFGCPVIVVTQSAKNLHEATTDIQLLVKSEKVSYNKENELLTWSFTNARVVRNSFDEVKVDKRARDRFKRIDPVDACVDAHYAFLKANGGERVNFSDELDDYMKMMAGFGLF